MNLNVILVFLKDHSIAFLTLHILSMAIGLGGATISDLLFFKFLKDYRISKKEAEVMHALKNVIMTAMLIIILSGLALYLPNMATYNASPMFLVKTIVVTVITINGIALHAYIAPRLIHVNLRKQERMGACWYSLAFALGAISICSWYSAFLIAMLKTVLPFSFFAMVTSYALLLVIAVFGSQIVRLSLQNKAKI